jgi:hypothetical protein
MVCCLCAGICELCVTECAKMADDEQMVLCAEACQRCAQSCSEMAAAERRAA